MAYTTMLYPNGLRKAVTLSYDDGLEQDIRLMDIMAKHGLKGTFNINTCLYAKKAHVYSAGEIQRNLSCSQATKVYAQSGNEVAIHMSNHGFPSMSPEPAAIYEVMEDKKNLESQFGRIVRGMAYPWGDFDDNFSQLLKKCGIAYARTTISTHGFNLPNDWLQLPPTVHHNDPDLPQLTRRFLDDPAKYRPMLFYLWGHSCEFEVHDNWQVIEDFAATIGGHSEIWYATNIEICDYVNAWHQLQSTCDCKIIHNPTATDLWLTYDNRTYSIGSGETLYL